MTTQELIVKYIIDNPGCIKRMYYPKDQAAVDESCLLDPNDWEFSTDKIVSEEESTEDQDDDRHWIMNRRPINQEYQPDVNFDLMMVDGLRFRRTELWPMNQPQSS